MRALQYYLPTHMIKGKIIIELNCVNGTVANTTIYTKDLPNNLKGIHKIPKK